MPLLIFSIKTPYGGAIFYIAYKYNDIMPPSGFSQEAINGLLVFVRDSYEQTLKRYANSELSEKDYLDRAREYVEGRVLQSVGSALEGTVSIEGAKGLAKFVSVNFEDLIKEIKIGKKREGEAMEAEIKDIGRYLSQFTIH